MLSMLWDARFRTLGLSRRGYCVRDGYFRKREVCLSESGVYYESFHLYSFWTQILSAFLFSRKSFQPEKFPADTKCRNFRYVMSADRYHMIYSRGCNSKSCVSEDEEY